ncbi:hypothetical protein BO78DRAFT_419572 [Aspergillus sclerotiicarbonarius CBS 121057]|uniref:Uncharacterized protein n=1 Tax=Aspergillus sclerotiicarbonarius (strain CBS 121057 / IBT 28362) TaxID=1448318 RepID=A0A319EGD6_ASPSB|nr:hypothetical protein BO78DRAFT_419572 [Aspergillus sclerotiicarbonarius CBS 121057]
MAQASTTRGLRRAIAKEIRQLDDAVDGIQTAHVGPDELGAMGIHVERVAPDGIYEALQFEPCFFMPLASTTLTDYPVVVDEDERQISPLYDESSCYPDGESTVWEWDTMEEARSTYHHVTSHVWAIQHDNSHSNENESKPLEDLTPWGQWTWKSHPSPQMANFSAPGEWRSMDWLENNTHPHAIVTLIHDLSGNDTSLARGEVKAVVWALRYRYKLKEHKSHAILPVLVLSYMGPKHGRIIQAHHDGQKLVVQCSPFIGLHEENSPEMSLFIRYELAIPVGLTTHSICVR